MLRELLHLKFPNTERILVDAQGAGAGLPSLFYESWEYRDEKTGKVTEYPPLIQDDDEVGMRTIEGAIPIIRAIHGMNNFVNLYYPYMKACTIYVQTSTSEGWCLTTQEARILRKPCVVTDIPVMHEQFADGENGIIANGTDAVSLYNGIMRLIKSPDLCNRIIKNLESTPQDGVMELNKLYDFLDE